MTAVRAANSGHLVLATLHAPTAASAVHSMLALGSHSYFLSGSLLGVIAQRLVRTLCPDCRSEYDISLSPQTFQEIESMLAEGEGKAIYGPSGCEKCFHLGYIGRSGLFEVMTANQEIRRLISEAASSHAIEEAAIRGGMTVFRRGALLKVAQGVTSTEEILRDVPAEQLGLED
jgi:type II secretory ATPase GspE/PulE/Tfp pilus assembly ATPase PilB-like protein